MQSLSLLITALTIACQMKNLMNNNEDVLHIMFPPWLVRSISHTVPSSNELATRWTYMYEE